MDLDGETNLKRRSAHVRTASKYAAVDAEVAALHSKLVLKCLDPDGDMYRFDGNVDLGDGSPAFAVDESNMLLRSARLSNTAWAVGLVVYTGHQSKVMLNAKPARFKQSNIDKTMNNMIVAILWVQIVMAILAGFGGFGFVMRGQVGGIGGPGLEAHSYLACKTYHHCNSGKTAFLEFFTYFILTNTLIPSSLLVTLEVAKVVHAAFITWDQLMVYGIDKDGNWQTAAARTSALNEELGQISYIFSDKTGTLTENCMASIRAAPRFLPPFPL